MEETSLEINVDLARMELMRELNISPSIVGGHPPSVSPTLPITRIEAIIEERKKLIQKKRRPPKERPPEILPEESIKSMNGIVRLICRKYGLKQILGLILFCEPSREKRGFEIIGSESENKNYLEPIISLE